MRGRGAAQAHVGPTAQGAEFHCAPMPPPTRDQVVVDWLDTIIG